jgi:hypothetical protein
MAAVPVGTGRADSNVPGCPVVISGYNLTTPSVEGDAARDPLPTCRYAKPDGGQEYAFWTSWVTKLADASDHPFYACGARPQNPATTFVSQAFEAYAGMQPGSPADFAAAARSCPAAERYRIAEAPPARRSARFGATPS